MIDFFGSKLVFYLFHSLRDIVLFSRIKDKRSNWKWNSVFFFYFHNVIHGIIKWFETKNVGMSWQNTGKQKKYQNQSFFEHSNLDGKLNYQIMLYLRRRKSASEMKMNAIIKRTKLFVFSLLTEFLSCSILSSSFCFSRRVACFSLL